MDQPANAALWTFRGLRLTPACRASGRTAAKWRGAGGEWVRPVVAPADWRCRWPEGTPEYREWAVDFPPGADARSVAEAGAAGRAFVRGGTGIARRGPAAELRIALAKCDRYLAAPEGVRGGRWRWVPASALPCGALVVVARDDDFLAAVLASSWLEVWRHGHGRRFDRTMVAGFPLPWSPDLPRGALSVVQEERRGAVVRAWRAAGGGFEDLDPAGWAAEELATAVAAAYGWPPSITPEQAWRRLVELSRPPLP